MSTSPLAKRASLASFALAGQVSHGWSTVRCLITGLKIAWVSVASVVLGMLLYSVPQVQDLFLEVKGSTIRSVGHWLWFYLAVLLAWSLPVYISSRWILSRIEQQHVDGAQRAGEQFPPWVKRWIPIVLVMGCMGAVLIGQLTALNNAPSIDPASAEAQLSKLSKEIQPIFSRCQGKSRTYQCLDLQTVIPFLKYRIYTTAAYLSGDEFGFTVRSEAVLLAIYGIVILLLGWLLARPLLLAGRSRAARIGGQVIWWLMTLLLVVPLLCALWLVAEFMVMEWQAELSLEHLALLPAVTLTVAGLAWWLLAPKSAAGLPTRVEAFALRLRGQDDRVNETAATTLQVAPLFKIILGCSLGFLALPVVLDPVLISDVVNRAPLLPFLLGFLVAPFTYLSYVSWRCRAPLVLTALLLASVSAVLIGDINDVRTIANAPRREGLDHSVERWAEVNNCKLGSHTVTSDCPSPLIISVAGGASRSAFHVAGVIGRLMDETARPIVGRGHTAPVGTAVFSPDSRTILTSSSDGTARLWNPDNGKVISVLNAHKSTAGNAVFSADGRRIVTAGGDRLARVWDVESGTEIAVLKGHEGIVWTASFSLDGTQVVTAALDHTVRLWNAQSGDEIGRLKSGNVQIRSASFSPDGRWIVTAHGQPVDSSDNTARVWDAASGTEVGVLRGHTDMVSSASFSPDGRRIVTSSYDRTARVWDAGSRTEITRVKSELEKFESAAFSPDGRRIVTTSLFAAQVWDVDSAKRIAVLRGHTNAVLSASYSPDGRRIVTSSQDRTLRVWDAETGHPSPVSLEPFARQLFAISGVSGGSLGAVVAYSAMADSQSTDRATNGPGRPPCKEASADTDWFGPSVRQSLRSATEPAWRPHESWRSCLQQILAGDFLSPVMVALATGTLVHRLVGHGDRAAVLEQSWETRYARLTGNKNGLPTLAEPLAVVRKRVLDQDKNNWLPVLLLNGTSVATGRRILTSDIDTVTFLHAPDGQILSRVFRDSYDLHELLVRTAGKSTPAIDAKPFCKDCDIRLSTAATMSARFPIISPHGTIRGRDGKVIDRVVDGGYFENFGATTAAELSRRLEQHGLKPTIILVNNEPTTASMDCITEKSNLAYPVSPQSTWLAVISAPIEAFTATRQARGTHAAVELCSEIGDHSRFGFITVNRDTLNPDKALSMSWWLSKHIQKYLDDQLVEKANAGNDTSFGVIQNARKLLGGDGQPAKVQ